jgi:hypothetical protein
MKKLHAFQTIKMNKYLQLITFSLWLLVSPIFSYAQESSCAVKLREAQELYSAGQIEVVPGLLHSCLVNGFTPEEKVQAYKLLINSYIFDDNLARAEYYMLQFLKNYPEYTVVDTDPYEFVSLLKQFGNSPRGSYGLRLGGNIPFVRVIEPFTVSPTENTSSEYSFSLPGFHAGFFYNFNLSTRFELGIEPTFSRVTFVNKYEPYPFVLGKSTELQGRISLPVSGLYLFPGKKVDFYLRGGLNGSYLLYGNREIVRSYQGNMPPPVKGPSLDLDGERQIFNLWTFFGAGLRYKIPKAYFFLDVRYNYGIFDQVDNSVRRNASSESIWLYYLNQDRFYLDDLNLSFGIAKTIYNPKKR